MAVVKPLLLVRPPFTVEIRRGLFILPEPSAAAGSENGVAVVIEGKSNGGGVGVEGKVGVGVGVGACHGWRAIGVWFEVWDVGDVRMEVYHNQESGRTSVTASCRKGPTQW